MSFELQPTLRGELVLLRPLQEQDFEALYEVASDPLIWEQHPRRDRYQRPVFEEFFRGAIESGGAFLVLDARNDDVIGSSRFCSYSPEHSEIEVGYTFLARHCWGHTYNREMKRLMLKHAFRFVESVVFVIGENNRRSRAAIEKIGARFEATIEREYPGPTPRGVRYRLKRSDASHLLG